MRAPIEAVPPDQHYALSGVDSKTDIENLGVSLCPPYICLC
jgi:hypothetical protein